MVQPIFILHSIFTALSLLLLFVIITGSNQMFKQAALINRRVPKLIYPTSYKLMEQISLESCCFDDDK